MKPSVLFLSLILAASLGAADGLIIRQTNEDMEQGSSSKSTIYLESNRMAIETDGGGRRMTILFLPDQDVVRMVEHDSKSYRDLNRAEMESRMAQVNDAMAQARARMEEQMKNMSPEQRAMVEKMMQGRMPAPAQAQPAAPPVKTEYRRGDGSAEIGGRSCDWFEGYQEDKMVSLVCAASWSDFDLSPDDFAVFEKLRDFFANLMPNQRGMMRLDSAGFSPQSGFPGVPLEQTRFSGGKPASKTTLDDVRRDAISDDLYQTPDGYQKMEMPGLGGR